MDTDQACFTGVIATGNACFARIINTGETSQLSNKSSNIRQKIEFVSRHVYGEQTGESF
jgi:hypothetical protein